jgi:probable toxin-antitoxin system toxin component, PIN family
MLGRKVTTMRTLLTYPTLEIYVCRELLDEFYDVSSREKIRKYIRPEDLDDTLKLIHLYGKYVVIRTQSKSKIRDEKDLYLLSLADTINANYIVTGDKDLLVLEKHNHTKIITITEFMKLL